MAGLDATINTGQLAVTTGAQLVIAANPNRHRIVLTNEGASAVFIGGSGVSTTTGDEIPAGQELPLLTTAAIYAIAAGTGNTVSYIEET